MPFSKLGYISFPNRDIIFSLSPLQVTSSGGEVHLPYPEYPSSLYVGKAKASCSIGMRFSQSLVVVLKEKPGVEQGLVLNLISFCCQEVNHPISRGE